MYNLCKSISIGTYTFTFDFYIDEAPLTIEFLFKNLNPIQQISIELNTSSFLLSYVDRLIGYWWEMWSKMKEISICGYILSFRTFTDRGNYISFRFVVKSVEYRQRVSIRCTSMIFIKEKLQWISYQFFSDKSQ